MATKNKESQESINLSNHITKLWSCAKCSLPFMARSESSDVALLLVGQWEILREYKDFIH
jgi:hypothetical protein